MSDRSIIIDFKMTTALCEVWKLRNENTSSLNYKWKQKEASEISSNSLILLKG